MKLITFLLLTILSLNAFAYRSGNPPVPVAGTAIDSDGFTVASGTTVEAEPQAWDATYDSVEACIVSVHTKTVSPTSTNSDGFILLRMSDIMKYDNVNVSVTRTSGTAKELDGRIMYGKLKNATDGGVSVANTIGNYNDVVEHVIYGLVDNQATSIDRDFNKTNMYIFNAAGTTSFQTSTGGTPPANTNNLDDMYYHVEYDADSGAMTIDSTITYYKCSEAGKFHFRPGVVLAGRWKITVYNQ